MGIYLHGRACPYGRRSYPRHTGDLLFVEGAFRHLNGKPFQLQLAHNGINIPTLSSRLSDRHDGLHVEAQLDPESATATLLVNAIEHGLIRGLSVKPEFKAAAHRGLKTIHRVQQLLEVSLSTDPGMPDTWVSVGASDDVERYSLEDTRELLACVLAGDFGSGPEVSSAYHGGAAVDADLALVQALHPGKTITRAPAGESYAFLATLPARNGSVLTMSAF